MIYVVDGDKRIPVSPDNVVGICGTCGQEFHYDIFDMVDEIGDSGALDVDICNDCAKEEWLAAQRRYDGKSCASRTCRG